MRCSHFRLEGCSTWYCERPAFDLLPIAHARVSRTGCENWFFEEIRRRVEPCKKLGLSTGSQATGEVESCFREPANTDGCTVRCERFDLICRGIRWDFSGETEYEIDS